MAPSEIENAGTSNERRRGSENRKHSTGEVVLIAVVLAYAGVLLAGPLVAILWGAFGSGIGAFSPSLRRATRSRPSSSRSD